MKDQNNLLSRLKKGIFIGIVLWVGAVFIIFAFTFSDETPRSLRSFKIEYLLLTIFLYVVSLIIDSYKFKMIIRGMTGKNLPLVYVLEVFLVGFFFSASTPFQGGGFAFQMYLLSRKGVSPGESSAAITLKGMTNFLFLVLMAPFLVYSLGISWAYKPLKFVVPAVILITILIFILARWPVFVLKWRKYRIVSWFLNELKLFNESFGALLSLRKWRILSIIAILTVTSVSLHLLMVPAIFYGIGVKVPVLKAITLHILTQILFIYSPTPGASGVMELGGAFVFSSICPKHLIGIFTAIWRFFTYYLSAFLGGILTVKNFSFLVREYEKTHDSI